MTRDPARRLGAGEADAEDIKRHPFFKDVNFEDVYNRRIPPPYFPTIGNATDTSNFDQEFTREQPTLTPVHTQLSAADQQEFAGFSWVCLLHGLWRRELTTTDCSMGQRARLIMTCVDFPGSFGSLSTRFVHVKFCFIDLFLPEIDGQPPLPSLSATVFSFFRSMVVI